MPELTDEQWEYVSPYLPTSGCPPGRGRPRQDDRLVLEAVLWVLRTEAAWHDLPDRYPPCSTCHQRFRTWDDSGMLDTLLHALARHLNERGGIDVSSRRELVEGLRGTDTPLCWKWKTARVFLSGRAWLAVERAKACREEHSVW
jgi:transposase